MPAANARPEHPDPLTVPGLVTPPTARVLTAARERLWSAIAEEMLAIRADTGTAEASAAREHRINQRDREA